MAPGWCYCTSSATIQGGNFVALSDPKNTLAYHQARTLTAYRDLREVPLSVVAAAIVEFRKNDPDKQTKPESEALWFYALNHISSIIRQRRHPLEPLSSKEDELVRLYYDENSVKAIRAFYYLIIICLREARHNTSIKQNDMTKINLMKSKFGKITADWFTNVGGGEETIHEKFLTDAPDTTIGNFMECIQWQFYHCKWPGSYGGPAWGSVSDCVVNFIKGVFTAEMMLDTVWTLEHNTAAIFNKGHFYAGQNSEALKRILDIQRAGQIPHAIVENDKIVKHYADPILAAFVKTARALWPEEIGEHVDWHTVKALGAIGHYPAEIANQDATWGNTPEMQAKAALAKAEAEAKAKAAAELAAKKAAEHKAAMELAKKEHAENWFEIMPGLEVKKIVRVGKAA